MLVRNGGKVLLGGVSCRACGHVSFPERSVCPTDVETVGNRGVQFTALYAMKARRTMEAYGIPMASVARVAVKNSRNGSLNPIAQFRKPQTIQSVLRSRPISEPLTLLMCSSIADGAAAALLVSERKAREAGLTKPVYVAQRLEERGRAQSFERHRRGRWRSFVLRRRLRRRRAGKGHVRIDQVRSRASGHLGEQRRHHPGRASNKDV